VRPTLLIKRDGNEMYIESTASPILDGSGAVSGGVLVIHDVSESRELNRKLSYHASHDILTGLVNRREFERGSSARSGAPGRARPPTRCATWTSTSSRSSTTPAATARATRCSGRSGALLKTKIRWRDTLARIGGDEFGVLLESCSLEEAMQMADQLRETIRNYKFVWEERTFRLGCSVGVVPITATARTSRHCSRRPTAPAPRPRRRAATASTASRTTTST
jgi:GGDEF domain-containing protein